MSKFSQNLEKNSLWQLTKIRTLEFLRQKEAIFWTFFFPVLLSVGLGLAFRNKPAEKIPVAMDERSDNASFVLEFLNHSSDLKASLVDEKQAREDLRKGKYVAFASVKQGHFEIQFDPTHPDSRIARLALGQALQGIAGTKLVTEISEVKIATQGSRYIDFLLPGLIGMNILGSGMWGLSFAIVQARSKKLLKLFATTPMSRRNFLLAYVFSRIFFLLLSVAFVLAFGHFAFQIQIFGSFLHIACLSALGAMAFGSIGLLVAARVKSSESAQGWINLIIMPMWLLSGTFFSSSRFPDWLQPLIKILPLTAFNEAMRNIVNDGGTLLMNLSQLGILGAWCLLSMTLAIRFFEWQ